MNLTIFAAARHAGCTTRQAEVLATYVESETVIETARKLRIAERTVKIHLSDVRLRLNAPHNAAAVAKLYAHQ